MKAKQTENQTQENKVNSIAGYVSDVRVFVSKDNESLIHKLPGGETIELHQNLYKKVLGISFEPKQTEDRNGNFVRYYGFRAKVQLSLSEDGNWLTHFFPGGRIRKHVNFYKRILGQDFTPVTANTQAAS